MALTRSSDEILRPSTNVFLALSHSSFHCGVLTLFCLSIDRNEGALFRRRGRVEGVLGSLAMLESVLLVLFGSASRSSGTP